MKLNRPYRFVPLCFVVLVVSAFCGLGLCKEEGFVRMKTQTLGGIHDCKGSQNSAEIQSMGRFAVEEHNKKENALLEFVRIVKAKEQVVAGKMYHLTLEAVDGGQKRIYGAKVWVKPWINFKQLQEFQRIHDAPSFTPAGLGFKRDGQGPGWQAMPTYDPVVQHAANHAVKAIQQRLNSLLPYELLEILLAKAKVIEDSSRFSLVLKVRRGDKVEKFRVVVKKDIEGKFYLNNMYQVIT